MASGRFLLGSSLGFSGALLGASVTLGGCGASDANEHTHTAGTTAAAGQSGAGAPNTMGGGGNGGGPAQTAGASSGGASAGATANGGTQNGAGGGAGTAAGGGAGAGAPSGGASGSGGASSSECTRALLDDLLDDYFEALSAGDASSLPLATNLKFTENSQLSQIGSTAFWMNAGAVKHSQRALDTTQCSAAAQAVIPESGTDLPVGLRIKVVAGKMTEIETIVVRPGDYTASFAVASNPGAIISAAAGIGWHDEVPQAQRATRQQLTSWIDKYFRAFPAGVCNVTSACRRLENGGGNFSCGAGASCAANTPTTGGEFVPRVTIVDEVRGIAAGFTVFDYQTSGHLDMHMIKMSGGQVHAVHALLRDTNGQSGWD